MICKTPKVSAVTYNATIKVASQLSNCLSVNNLHSSILSGVADHHLLSTPVILKHISGSGALFHHMPVK